MSNQTEGQMYLASARGITNRTTFRSFHTFNFGDYFDESRKSFGNLNACNDDTLAAGNAIITNADKDTEIFILPIVGCLEIKDGQDVKNTVEASQAFILRIKKGEYYQISNPFKDELINFLQIWIENDSTVDDLVNDQINFYLDSGKNQLQTISKNYHIGKFSGREAGIFTIKEENKGAFVFIIEGAFEFQNRLLEARDSLALWNEDNKPLQIEFEALSNDAIVLIIEVATKA